MSQPSHKEHAGYEGSDANAKGIFWFAIAFIMSGVGMHLGLGSLFFALRRHEARQATPINPQPQQDLKAYLDQENQALHSYGWINPQKRVVRVPIERAMEIYLKQNSGTGETSHE